MTRCWLAAIAAFPAVACSSFEGTAIAPAEAGAVDASTEASDAQDAGTPSVSFCDGQSSVTTILCDDFESGSTRVGWKKNNDNGVLSVVEQPGRGRVLKMEASEVEGVFPSVALSLDLDLAIVRAGGFTVDFDIRVETAGFDYIQLASAATSNTNGASIVGLSKGGPYFGGYANPQAMPHVAFDASTWHHVHADYGPSAQVVTLDGADVDTAKFDLEAAGAAGIAFGILTARSIPTDSHVAVVFYDNARIAKR